MCALLWVNTALSIWASLCLACVFSFYVSQNHVWQEGVDGVKKEAVVQPRMFHTEHSHIEWNRVAVLWNYSVTLKRADYLRGYSRLGCIQPGYRLKRSESLVTLHSEDFQPLVTKTEYLGAVKYTLGNSLTRTLVGSQL